MFNKNYFEVITKLYPYFSCSDITDINQLLEMSSEKYRQFIKKLIKDINKQKINIKVSTSTEYYKRYRIILRGNKKVISITSLIKRIIGYGILIEEVKDQNLNVDDINICFCNSKELITYLIDNFEKLDINRSVLVELIIQKYYNYER